MKLTKIYACLIGEWVCLNDDSNCKIGNSGASVSLWLKQNNEYGLGNINIHYKGKDYMISSVFIQVITE